MKYPFGSEPNNLVVFPVLSFSFTNEMTLQVPTSCCLSGSAAPADNVPHVRAAAIGIDNSAFMVLPPIFRHVPFMTGSGLAVRASKSLYGALGGQWGNPSHNTAPTASTGLTTPRRGHAFEKGNRPKGYGATPEVVPRWPHDHVGDPARKPSS